MFTFLCWVVLLTLAAIVIGKMLLVEKSRLKRRIEEAHLVAAQTGFMFNTNRHGFQEIIPTDLLEKIKGLNLFRTDGYQLEKCISFVFQKNDAVIKTYLFEHYESDVTAGHKESVACFVSHRLSLPKFCLSPNNLLLRGLSLAMPSVKFALYPDFTKNYYLSCDEETAVRLIFTTEVVKFLEGNYGLWIEGRGDTLICCRYNVLHELKDLPQFYAQAKTIGNFFLR